VLFAGGLCAQWVNYPAPGTPRTRDGKPNLTAPAPRASNGKPDLSGLWHVQPTGVEEMKRLFGADLIRAADQTSVPGMELDTISKYALNIFADFKPEDTPMRPEAAKLFGQRAAGAVRDPGVDCLPLGIPISSLVSEVHKIVQTPGLIVILLEVDNAHRQIYTDGRKLPVDPQPSWLAHRSPHHPSSPRSPHAASRHGRREACAPLKPAQRPLCSGLGRSDHHLTAGSTLPRRSPAFPAP